MSRQYYSTATPDGKVPATFKEWIRKINGLKRIKYVPSFSLRELAPTSVPNWTKGLDTEGNLVITKQAQ